MIKGFTCGAFDLCHAGHIKMFKEARSQCDYLIVGLQTNPAIDRPRNKKNPIQSLEERWIQLSALKYIDEIHIYETEDDLIKLLRKLKPDIRIIGADWKGRKFTGHTLKIKPYFNTRKHNYSTSELIHRIRHEKRN